MKMKIKADEIEDGPCFVCQAKYALKHGNKPLKILLKCEDSDGNQNAVSKETRKRKNETERQKLELKIQMNDGPNTKSMISKQPDDIEHKKSLQLKMDSDSAGAGTSSQPSLWSHCLAKMKEELKAEVIEEVIKVLSKKDDNLSDKAPLERSEHEEKPVQIHGGVICDICEEEIHGIRYKCGNCNDFDLCERCEVIPNSHDPYHILLKIRYPQGQPKSTNFHVKPTIAYALPTLLEALKIRTRSPAATSTMDFLVHVISDVTAPENSILEPNVKFLKTWKIQNVGGKAWDENTVLKYVCGDWNATQIVTEVVAPKLAPFQEGVISVSFVSPSVPGSYEAYWQFHRNGQGFLDLLYCRIIVGPMANSGNNRITPVKTLRLPSRRYNLSATDFNFHELGPVRNRRKSKEEKRKKKDYRTKEVKDIVDVLNAVQEDCLAQRAVSASSSTTTPNNTPFDLTPPKSPEHHNIVQIQEAVSEPTLGTNSDRNTYNAEDTEDSPSIISISSSESDSEFVIIPVPDCFNFSTGQFVSKSSSEPSLNEYVESTTVWVANEAPNDLSRETSVHEAVTENVCQETGAPEEIENFNIHTVIKVKETDGLTITVGNTSVLKNTSADASTFISNRSAESIETRSSLPELNSTPRRHGEHNYTITEQPHFETPPPSFRDLHDGSSATFPKFPLEEAIGNDAMRDQPPDGQDERTIQVLPEGLVTGALLAAASVFNTAKAVISSIQTGRNDDANSTLDNNAMCEFLSPAEQLAEMGFFNHEQNERLLQKHKGSVPLVVAELVSLNDNDWYASRHATSPNTQH